MTLSSIILRLEELDRQPQDRTIIGREQRAAKMEELANDLYRLAHQTKRGTA